MGARAGADMRCGNARADGVRRRTMGEAAGRRPRWAGDGKPAVTPPPCPHPADVHVGQRVRLLRERQGLNHAVVAKSLGVTYQQLYKYEAGINRISASRLWELAGVLQCEVSEFFEGLSAERSTVGLPPRPRDGLAAVLDTPGGALLIEHFLKMPDTVQLKVAAFAASVT